MVTECDLKSIFSFLFLIKWIPLLYFLRLCPVNARTYGGQNKTYIIIYMYIFLIIFFELFFIVYDWMQDAYEHLKCIQWLGKFDLSFFPHTHNTYKAKDVDNIYTKTKR